MDRIPIFFGLILFLYLLNNYLIILLLMNIHLENGNYVLILI